MISKEFRGLLAHNAQVKIPLKTLDGATGYRITKFSLFPNTPGTTYYENVVKIFSKEQSAYDGTVDFDDNLMLGAGYNEGDANNINIDGFIIYFGRMVFNQDIFVTNYDNTGQDKSCNYYIELEQVMLRDNENHYITLKDIKNTLPQHGP